MKLVSKRRCKQSDEKPSHPDAERGEQPARLGSMTRNIGWRDHMGSGRRSVPEHQVANLPVDGEKS
jgi:hypothetical protein